MKKILLAILLLSLSIVLIGCKEDTTATTEAFNPTFSVEDIALTVGNQQSIIYELAPAGTLADVTLSISSTTSEDVISINNLTISALQNGTVTVLATATNKDGASNEFTLTATFTVTVTGGSTVVIPVTNTLVNGDFEDDINNWTITSDVTGDIFVTDLEVPHGGTDAFKLWYDNDSSGTSDARTITLSQTLTDVEAGTYLFSLWYYGSSTSVDMSILNGETVLSTESFNGYDYTAVPDNSGYVNYGIDVTLTETTTVTVQIVVVLPEGGWGFIDDVSFATGTVEDLLKAPDVSVDGVNQLVDGDFTTLDGWTVVIDGTATNKTAVISGGKLQIWADGPASFDIYQTVMITEDSYYLELYINGGVYGSNEYNASESVIYIYDGTTTYTQTLTPVGWDSGNYLLVQLTGLDLNGTYEVGIHIVFDGGTNNWITVDNFGLYTSSTATN